MSAPPTPWMRRLPHRPDPAAPPRRDLFAPAPAEPPVRVSAPVAAPATGGLTSLTGTTASAPVEPAPLRGAALQLVPPPGVHDVVTLDPDDPVVRMDALQSAIGGLLIRGAVRVAWEDASERSGVVVPGGSSTGDDMPHPGNRSLVRPFEGDVLVTLRHVRALRRLLIDAPSATPVTLTPYCAGVVRSADPTTRLRMSVVVVEGRLEVRAEFGLPDDWSAALTAMGWSPLALIPRDADVWL